MTEEQLAGLPPDLQEEARALALLHKAERIALDGDGRGMEWPARMAVGEACIRLINAGWRPTKAEDKSDGE